jgi:hypothetical protein
MFGTEEGDCMSMYSIPSQLANWDTEVLVMEETTGGDAEGGLD